ncbi:MAG TPA: hypothetical protein VJ783_02315 [Pirellulales bacterium]|nr:hypothetical protein [Pirellulales bacterium]
MKFAARYATLALALVLAAGQAHAQSARVRSAPLGSRGAYGTNFGNRYQYFGLGYGYQNWQGAWKPYSYSMGRRGGGGGGGGGGYGSGMSSDMQLEMLHERQMMWTMHWAPIPEIPPLVNYNDNWNPYQSRLADEYYRPRDPAPQPQTVYNPFVKPRTAN